jgi:hypothetical protein
MSKMILAPGGRGCAKNPVKRFLVTLVVLKK